MGFAYRPALTMQGKEVRTPSPFPIYHAYRADSTAVMPHHYSGKSAVFGLTVPPWVCQRHNYRLGVVIWPQRPGLVSHLRCSRAFWGQSSPSGLGSHLVTALRALNLRHLDRVVGLELGIVFRFETSILALRCEATARRSSRGG